MANGEEWDDARRAREQRKRNIALGLVLFGLVALFFVMTMVRMQGEVANWFY